MALNKKLLMIAIVFAGTFSSICYAQQVKYWIGFKDKQGTPYSLNKPEDFLGTKAINRRKLYYIGMHPTDLPVTPAYVNQVKNVANVRVLYSSRWLNGVVISFDSAKYAGPALAQINTFTFVTKTDKVKRTMLVTAPVNTVQTQAPYAAVETEATSYDYGRALWQNQQLNLVCLHDKGF